MSWASHHSLAGSALIEIPGAERDAAAELEQAAQLYEAGEPGEVYRYTLEAGARIDLGTARLRAGALDAATDAVEPVLSLPPSKRTLELSQRMTAVRAELAQPIFRGSVQHASWMSGSSSSAVKPSSQGCMLFPAPPVNAS